MNGERRGPIVVLAIVTIGVLAFFVLRPEPPSPEGADWPSNVALIGTSGPQALGYLAVLSPSTQAVAELNVDTVIEIPGTGFLRASQAHRLGGEALTRAALSKLFGVEVPFSVTAVGSTLEAVVESDGNAEIPKKHVDNLSDALTASLDWTLGRVLTTKAQCPEGVCLAPVPKSVEEVSRLVGGLGTDEFFTAPTVRPAPTPTTTQKPTPTARRR